MWLGPALLLVASCDTDLWDVGHSTGTRLSAERPECPVMWDTIPLAFSQPAIDSIVEKAYKRRLPNGIILQGSGAGRHLAFTPRAVVDPATGSNISQDGELPLSGPITNIPEFHDCQKFLSSDGTQFDSLFAIFASFKMDETMQALTWTQVVAWTAGPANVISVDPVTGIVRGEGPGTGTISGVDPNGNAIGSYNVVVNGSVSPDTEGPSLAIGPGVPLDTIAAGELRKAVLQRGAMTSNTIAAATIYSYGNSYAALGIEPNFNCLYVYFDTESVLRAKMIPMKSLDEYEHACLTAVNPNDVQGTPLAVVRSQANLGAGPSNAANYPAVARWDSDSTGKQHIGIKCLDAWCEIGDPTQGPFQPTPAYPVSAAAPVGEKKVVKIKGWYDEQILAVPESPGSDKLKPSGLRGTVIPVPELRAVTAEMLSAATTDNGDPWTLVAYVAVRDLANDQQAVDHYRTGLGFELAPVGPLETLNQMRYCYGTRDDCQVPSAEGCGNWLQNFFYSPKRVWVKVTTPGGTSKVLCVTRRGHPATPLVVGTARWRWILGDDTIWTACVQGCCQTDPGW